MGKITLSEEYKKLILSVHQIISQNFFTNSLSDWVVSYSYKLALKEVDIFYFDLAMFDIDKFHS